METMLGSALIFTITLPVSFYAARECLRGLIFLIYWSSRASRPGPAITLQPSTLRPPA
jgi:hypothetical protein